VPAAIRGTPARAPTDSPPDARRRWRLDAGLLALGAVALRLPAFFADRHLTFDDGSYGVSALLMRDGKLPYQDIFSSQGPLFLPILYVADLLGLRTANGTRLLALGAAVALTVATYATARYVTARGGALVAAGLVATSGSVLYTTAGLASDGPALALAVGAVALALRYRSAPSPGAAAVVGVVLGAALSVKLLVLPAGLVVAFLLVGARRPRDTGLAVGSAMAIGLAATATWGFGDVWEQYISYHRESARILSYPGAIRRLVVTLVERDAFLVALGMVVAFGMLVAAIRRGRGPGTADGQDHPLGERRAVLVLAGWTLATAVVLVVEPAFWRPHLAQIVPPLALLVGLRPPPLRLLGIVVVVLVPWQVAHTNDLLWPADYDRAEQAAVTALEALPYDALVITDNPGLAWRAERRIPGFLVDSSIKRIEQHQITTAVLARAAARSDVCAVLVWDDRYGNRPHLPARLADIGYRVEARYGGPRVLYERPTCRA